MKLKLVNAMYRLFKEHEVGIRTGAIVVTTIYAVYRAAKDSPRIMQRLEELDVEGATNLEKAKEIIPMAAPSALATAASVGLTLSSGKKAADTISSLSSAYTLMATAKSEFEEHAEKIVGKDKVQEINRSIADSKYPDSESSVRRIIDTGHGNDLFYFKFSDDWFQSDVNYIRNMALNTKNRVLGGYMVHWNEFAKDLGLPAKKSNQHLAWTDEQLMRKLGDDELVTFDAGIDENNKVYTIVELCVEPEITRRRY